MNVKIREIERLMAEGYEVEDVSSDEHAIFVTLNGNSEGFPVRQVVELDHDDAAEVLFGGSWKRDPELVTTPLL